MGKSTLRFALHCAVLLLAAATCHSLHHNHPDLAAHPGHSLRLVKRNGVGRIMASLHHGGKASKMATAGAGTVDETAKLASKAARGLDNSPSAKFGESGHFYTVDEVAKGRAEASAKALDTAKNGKARGVGHFMSLRVGGGKASKMTTAGAGTVDESAKSTSDAASGLADYAKSGNGDRFYTAKQIARTRGMEVRPGVFYTAKTDLLAPAGAGTVDETAKLTRDAASGLDKSASARFGESDHFYTVEEVAKVRDDAFNAEAFDAAKNDQAIKPQGLSKTAMKHTVSALAVAGLTTGVIIANTGN